MRVIRFFIYGVPLALLAILVAAFVNSTQLKTLKKNEFTYGSIGEASKLNPILSTDEGSSDVIGLIFEGLLTMNEKMEMVPWLATSFTESQHTTITFRSPEDARKALALIEQNTASWPEWTLTNAVQEGEKLILTLDKPGTASSNKIVGLLDATTIVPATTLRADFSGDARKALEKFRAAHPEIIIDREWFDYDLAFEITMRGAAAELEKTLGDFVATLKDGKSAVSRIDERLFIAEPVIRFLLRDDVKWQDGEPFTSRDAVFTFNSLMSEEVASPRKSSYDLVRDVQAPNDFEFVVTYRRPYSPAILSWTMALLPAHILEGKSQNWWAENFDRHPVGTGPFIFDSWKTNEYLKVVRNPNYWGTGPWLDAFIFRTIPDPTALRLAFESHQLDVYPLALSPWAIKSYRADPRFQVESAPALAYSYIGWNLRKEIFQDIRVRTAFAHAINVPEIIQFLAYNNGQQSTGIFVPEFWFADPTIKPISYDPEKAKQLLEEAGWKVGPDGIRVKDGQRLSFKIITNQGNEVRRDVATLAQDNLRKIGVEVKIDIYEWAVFIQDFINKHEFDATVLAWGTPPDWDQFQVWHSSQTNPDQLNHVGYKSPEADKLITELREEYDRDRIKELAGKLQRRIYEDQPLLFMNAARETIAIWRDSIRIRRKNEAGEWLDTPFRTISGDWKYYTSGFYRTEYADKLPPAPNLKRE